MTSCQTLRRDWFSSCVVQYLSNPVQNQQICSFEIVSTYRIWLVDTNFQVWLYLLYVNDLFLAKRLIHLGRKDKIPTREDHVDSYLNCNRLSPNWYVTKNDRRVLPGACESLPRYGRNSHTVQRGGVTLTHGHKRWGKFFDQKGHFWIFRVRLIIVFC